jgi:hypothetical protein
MSSSEGFRGLLNCLSFLIMDIFLEKGKELQLPYEDKVYKHTVDLVFCSDTEQELEELTKLYEDLEQLPQTQLPSVVRALTKIIIKKI